MPEYKLCYANARGLAEVPRQLFALAGVPFENIGLTPVEFNEFKKKTPFGQMPVLFIDGKPLPEMLAIARYIASLHGLTGQSPLETAFVDQFADQWKDFYRQFRHFRVVKVGLVEGDVNEARIKYAIPARDIFFPLIVRQLEKNGTGFLVGDSVTWVDVLVANTVEDIESKEPGFCRDYPEVLKHQQRIHAIPALKKWIEKRPDSKA